MGASDELHDLADDAVCVDRGFGVAFVIVGLWRWNRSDWVVVCERGVF